MAADINKVFLDLLDSQYIYSLRHSFYKETGLLLHLVDLSGGADRIFFPEKEYPRNPFCKMIYGNSAQEIFCHNESVEMGNKAALTGKGLPLFYPCHAGLVDVVVPVFIKNTHIGMLSTGQFRNSKKVNKNLKNKLKAFPENMQAKLKRYYFSTKYLSKEEIKKITYILTFISAHITEYGESVLTDKQSMGVEGEDVVRKVRGYIKNNCADPNLSLRQLAKEVGFSAAYLSDLYKKKANQNLTDTVTYSRIRLAKHLLLSTNKSIKNVGYSSGFKTIQHFYRVFKKIENITPVGFRKKSKKDKE